MSYQRGITRLYVVAAAIWIIWGFYLLAIIAKRSFLNMGPAATLGRASEV